MRFRGGLLDRRVNVRDCRLFVVAVEGEDTEPWYFNGLVVHGIVAPHRVRILPLPPQDNDSHPRQVAARLHAHIEVHGRLAVTEYWLVVDVDRHKGLETIIRDAWTDGFEVAVSDPCFEVWLQLHFTGHPLGELSGQCKRAWGALRMATAANLPWPFERHHVEAAVARGRAADTGPRALRPPHPPASHVHRLVGRILEAAGARH